jgi:hypothetical protein
LVLSGSTLYGTLGDYHGLDISGTFTINTDGSGFQSGVAYPQTSQNILGNTVYGASLYDGTWGNGAIFAVNTNGTGGTNLYSFSPGYYNNDGSKPAGVTLAGYVLYGTTSSSGLNGRGTLFSLSFLPQLTISSFGTNVFLMWPTNVAGFDYTGFTLQATTNPAVSSGWTIVSPPPVIINGQNTVTNPISANQLFYRLSQ